ncbi:MAG: hypothetical protein KAU95_03775 [Candidatus Aenigmarchaeota archaeon]|nr:hypothetical protein [Candidatus Aenigmarchaeota archaeon]
MCKLLLLLILLGAVILFIPFTLFTGTFAIINTAWIYFAGFSISVFFLSLACMVFINLKSSKGAKEDLLDRHAMRRALMITFTVVYFILLFKESEMMGQFNLLYLSMIAFYFGSRGLEKYAEVLKAGKKKTK